MGLELATLSPFCPQSSVRWCERKYREHHAFHRQMNDVDFPASDKKVLNPRVDRKPRLNLVQLSHAVDTPKRILAVKCRFATYDVGLTQFQ